MNNVTLKPGIDSSQLTEAKVAEAKVDIRKFMGRRRPPKLGVILGTGSGGLARFIENKVSVPFGRIRHLATSTAPEHVGKLIVGTLGGKAVIALQGRLHYYEGYSMQQITFPIRVMQALGVDTLIMTNAAGGVSTNVKLGDLMVIDDHINLMGDNPLIGPNDDALGPRFPDMSCPYDLELRRLLHRTASSLDMDLAQGVYVAMAGPNYETKAEVKFLRTIGGDVAGMSTVPENLVAVQLGMRVLAISVVTNVHNPDSSGKTSAHDVAAAGRAATPKLSNLLRRFIRVL